MKVHQNQDNCDSNLRINYSPDDHPSKSQSHLKQSRHINLLFINTNISLTILNRMLILYFLISLGLLAAGLIVLIIEIVKLSSNAYISKQILYYDANDTISCSIGDKCTRSFVVLPEQEVNETIVFSYLIDGWLHKNSASGGYLRSFNRKQLAGLEVSDDELKNQCGFAYLTNQNLSKTISISGKQLPKNQIANPCGLIALNYNNDTFQIFHVENGVRTEIQLLVSETLWNGYAENQFSESQNSNQTQWISHKQPHLMAWMINKGLPRTKIMWGLIKNGLKAGTYQIEVTLNYHSILWPGGDRFIYLEHFQIFNGKSIILPVMIVILGFAFIVLALSIQYKKNKQEKKSI